VWSYSLFTANLDFSNLASPNNAMIGDQEDDVATGASAVVTAVNPQVNITTNLTLSVTTTATINASQFNNTAIGCQDPSSSSMEEIILFGRFLHTLLLFLTPYCQGGSET